jgi:hypothetical protein
MVAGNMEYQWENKHNLHGTSHLSAVQVRNSTKFPAPTLSSIMRLY